MGFLKDMKSEFKKGYDKAMAENQKENDLIESVAGKRVETAKAREVFMKIKEKELNEEFLDWCDENEIHLI